VPPIVTTTSPLPAAWDGKVAWIVTGSMTCTFVAATPATVTDDASAEVKPAPKMVMVIGALGTARFGVTLTTANAGTV